MNVLLCFNKAFFEMAIIMLKTLFQNNRRIKINVFIFYNELGKAEIKALAGISNSYRGTLTAIRISEGVMDGVPVKAWAKETYYRLFAVKMLPKNLKRVLYLDVDMLIVGNLRKLYRTDLEGYYFAAVPDTSLGMDKYKHSLGIPEEYPYVNAGVLLMNLKDLRKELDIDFILDFARRYPHKVINCDQDIINSFYYKKIKLLDKKYNFEARYHSIEDLLMYPLQYLKFRLLRNIKIIHYMGSSKPWKVDFNGKFGIVYYQMVKNTELRGQCIYNFKHNFWNALKYLLETGYF